MGYTLSMLNTRRRYRARNLEYIKYVEKKRHEKHREEENRRRRFMYKVDKIFLLKKGKFSRYDILKRLLEGEVI